MWENCPITCDILVRILLRVLQRAGWRWRELGGVWNELGGGGWTWVEVGAWFSNTRLLWVSSFSGSVKIFRLLFTSLKLCKTLLSSIVVYRELLLIWFSINLLVSLWVKLHNDFSNFHNSQIASIKFFINCFDFNSAELSNFVSKNCSHRRHETLTVLKVIRAPYF